MAKSKPKKSLAPKYPVCNFKIIPAGREDALRYASLHTQEKFNFELQFFNELIQTSNSTIFFLMSGSVAKGYATVNFRNPVAFIADFAVIEKRKGIGRIFYNELESTLKKSGISQITLVCPFEGASVFWRKMGFRPQKGIFFKKNL